MDQTSEDNRLAYVVQKTGQPYYFAQTGMIEGLTVPMLLQMYLQGMVRKRSEADQHTVLTLDYLEGKCTQAYLMGRTRRKISLTSTIPFPEYGETLERWESSPEDRDIHQKIVSAMSFIATGMTAFVAGDAGKGIFHVFDAFTSLMEAHQMMARKRMRGMQTANPARVDMTSKNLPKRQRRTDIFAEGPAGSYETSTLQPQGGAAETATRGVGIPTPQEPQWGSGYGGTQGREWREGGGSPEQITLQNLRQAIWQAVGSSHAPTPQYPPPPGWQRGRFRGPRVQKRGIPFPPRGGGSGAYPK